MALVLFCTGIWGYLCDLSSCFWHFFSYNSVSITGVPPPERDDQDARATDFRMFFWEGDGCFLEKTVRNTFHRLLPTFLCLLLMIPSMQLHSPSRVPRI